MNNKETKNEINTLLQDYLVSIDFVKKDGTNRTLLATAKIPKDKLPKGPKPDATEEDVSKYEATQQKIKDNDNLLRVFDYDKQEWRSVNIDSIKSYQLIPFNRIAERSV